ncbi:MFS transporter [Rhizobium johnstonii]|jgi:putative MFS transporter|uniref:MFS transporter n=1 Tax=Rhizobium TaxID=379 RepID=UPI00140FE120|nr:MFS transporter [Rhizobium leguminosarum]QIO64050.1 MFS transporter [Rhizobium leguminosarum bv. trifolii]
MLSANRLDSEAMRLVSELDALKLTRLHIALLAACCIAFSFDLAEIAFGNILSAVFSAQPYVVSDWQLSLLLSAVYVGAVFGAPAFGWLADRHGRRLAMCLAMALLAVVSFGAGFSRGIDNLIGWRIAAGLSLGAYPPLMFAYLTDVLPARKRGPLLVTATAIGYLGPTTFIFFVRALAPESPLGLEPWRWGFLLAGVGAAGCALVFWKLPESPRWLIARGRLDEAAAILGRLKRSAVVETPFRESPREERDQTISLPEGGLRGLTAFLLTIYLLTPWATVGFTLLSGAVFVEKGMDVRDSLLYVGISTFGPIIGTLFGGAFVDRFERRNFLIGTAVAMVAAGLMFGASDVPALLIAAALFFNVVTSLFIPVLVLYSSEAIPTPQRAKVTAWAWMSNRVGSTLVPLVLLPVLHIAGPLAMFGIVAMTLAIFIVVMVVFGPIGGAGRVVK